MMTIDNYDAKIFTDDIEQSAVEQIELLLSVGVFSNCKIRIMPDVHAGAGCVIGFTGDLGDKVIPNIVGVDIGCGIYVRPFVCVKDIDWHGLNGFILHNIPSGRNHRNGDYATLPDKYMDGYREAKEIVKALCCNRELKDNKRLYKSIGTLGGGNHFIEVDRDEAGMHYLVVHTGSRNLGKQVAQIVGKYLSGAYARFPAQRFHLSPDIAPVPGFPALCHKDRAGTDFLCRECDDRHVVGKYGEVEETEGF